MRPTTYRDDGHDHKTLERMITKVTKTWKRVKMWKWQWEWQIEKWGDSNDDGDGKIDGLESRFLWHAIPKGIWWVTHKNFDSW